ncbi:MAG TPA: diacylglycerol kinase family protein [Gemmatimonadales bacterium]|nr:diacylglycerol kinase family protein [Gemmatimonadales bacterium]
MARVLLITNPAAARTRSTTVRAVRDVLRAAGWHAEVAATSGPGDARRLAEEGVAAGVDIVAVFGGDGTTMQAASALVGTEVALGLIPGGTGNLLAGNLRIPASPARAAEVLVRGVVRRLDLGRLVAGGEQHYFAVACGTGYDARVMVETPSELKQKWGIGAYVATTLRLIDQVRSIRHLITVDGVEYEAHAALVLVANCAEVIPPLIRFGDGVSPEDGLLDVVVLRADSLAEGVHAVWQFLRGGPGSRVGHVRGREIRVETDRPEPVQLDGDAGGTTPFTATVVPAALRVLSPPAP